MAWQLSPGVSFCEIGVHLVVFDLSTDRYLALGATDRCIFQTMREGRAVNAHDAAGLIQAGLIVDADGESNFKPVSVTVPQDDLSSHNERASIRGIARTAASLAWARRAATRSRIAPTMTMLTYRKRQLAASGKADAVIGTALGFAGCRPYVPIARRCLIDSFALLDLLLDREQSATLVFGVRMEPFGAHCWLQTEHHILTCPADDALGFTPIMVV